MTETRITPTDGPIHTWFSLSYCNYQVLHRTLMQSMPIEWQQRMVACLTELQTAFEHVPQPEVFDVKAATEHEVCDLTEAQRKQAGITADWYRGETPPEGWPEGWPEEDLAEWRLHHEDPDGPTYSRDGEELDPHERVLLPAVDPVPHYNRGRTYIEPRICDRCKGSGVDPENTASEDYGDIVRELPEPCSACQFAATPSA